MNFVILCVQEIVTQFHSPTNNYGNFTQNPKSLHLRPGRWTMGNRQFLYSHSHQRTTAHHRYARSPERHLLSSDQRMWMAKLTPRLSSRRHCAALFSSVAAHRHLGQNARCVARTSTSQSGTRANAQCGKHRFANGQISTNCRTTGLRCGKKKSMESSGTLRLTRLDGC